MMTSRLAVAVRPLARAAPRRVVPATSSVRHHSAYTEKHVDRRATVVKSESGSVPGDRAKSTVAAPGATPAEVGAGGGFLATLGPRFATTVEIAVSKIFPAGAGWQAASCLAEGAGFASDSTAFYLTTGAGDFAGVLAGHTAFYAAKKLAYDPSIDMKAEAQTGLLLASAAFGSGFVWQLALNQFQAASLPFVSAAVATGAVCGAVFFGGLRLSRAVYPKLGLRHIEPPTYLNMRNDAALSVAIGGATGMFVGTDVSYADNIFRGFVGIEEHFSTAAGVATAGKSTAVGFLAVQSAMNAFLPSGRNWLDQADAGRE